MARQIHPPPGMSLLIRTKHEPPLKHHLIHMKKLSIPPTWGDTPRTNALIEEVQATPVPFDIAFWQLLELTRVLEFENNQFRKAKTAKTAIITTRASKAKKRFIPEKNAGTTKRRHVA